MILDENIPATITKSLKGDGYLDFNIAVDDGEKIKVTMTVENMAGLGTLMTEVANTIAGRTIDFSIESADLNPNPN